MATFPKELPSADLTTIEKFFKPYTNYLPKQIYRDTKKF